MTVVLAEQIDAVAARSPEAVREAAARVLQRPYYNVDAASGTPGETVFEKIIHAIDRALETIVDAINSLPMGLKWFVVIAASILCALLIVHLAKSLSHALGVNAAVPRQRTNERDVLGEIRGLEHASAEAVAQGDYCSGIHYLMRAAVCHIENARGKNFRPGVTNRDLLRLLESTLLASPLGKLVDSVDVHWYGGQPCTGEAFTFCRNAYLQVRDHAARVFESAVSA